MNIYDLINAIVAMFLEMAPYIILGLIFVALLNLLVSKEMIGKQLGGNNFLSVLKAALFGIPLPLCSCGVVPTAVYMSKNGASKAATTSFLISTPQTGIDSIIATYGMLGPMFAIFRPFAALVMGLAGGFAVKLFDKDANSQATKPAFINLTQLSNTGKINTVSKPKLSERIKQTLNYSFVEFLDDISVRFVFGVIVAGMIAYFVPDDFFVDTGFNSGILGMLLMIAIGIPMYICATASIPIAMSLIMKGFSPGVAFVFLAAGPAVNVASISIISKSLGKKITMIFLLSISVFSIIMGYLLDFVYSILGESSIVHNHSEHNHGDMFLNHEAQLIIGIIFAVMILFSFYRKYLRRYFNNQDNELLANDFQKIMIEGMTCNHCVATVTNTALKISGIEEIDVRLDENSAYIKGNFSFEEFKRQIQDVGYTVKN
jgi:uncharacterized membrane protein YraQ (UPF0718 family)/copper chaperone CopZ